MSLPTSEGVETVAQPAVNTLRSRFEQLALDTSSPSSSPSPNRPINDTRDLLTAETPSPRARASSNPKEPSSPFDPSRHVRNSSSSSDLKAAGKRPPPPPPSRATKPSASPSASPHLRPVPVHAASSGYASDVSTSSQSSIRRLSDRRPPPIPSALLDGESSDSPTVGSVASLRNVFA